MCCVAKLSYLANAAAGLQRKFKPEKEVSDRAGMLWVRADRKLAEELDKLPKATGTRGTLAGRKKGSGGRAKEYLSGGSIMAPPDRMPTLAEMGVAKKHAARARKRGFGLTIFQP